MTTGAGNKVGIEGPGKRQGSRTDQRIRERNIIKRFAHCHWSHDEEEEEEEG